MSELPFRQSIGVPAFDLARYSAPPEPIGKVEAFAGGLFVFELPRMADAQVVHAPGIGADVFIYTNGPMAVLERPLASELPGRSVRGGNMVIIPEGLATDWWADDGQARCHHIHVSRSLRSEWADDLGVAALRPVINETTSEIDTLFAALENELASDNAFRRLRLQALTLSALAACYRLGSAFRPRPHSTAMTPARLRRVRSYVEENLGEDVCLEAMAACIGLSPSHFSRAFKAETGVSPYAFVLRLRTERAKGLMRDTNMCLAEIALACGFASQSHFTDAFRSATGTPPARWRREQRQ